MRKVVIAMCALLAIVAIAVPAGAQEDTTPPQLHALSVSPNVIDTSAGPQVVTVTATVTDDLSGVNAVDFAFGSPAGGLVVTTGVLLPVSGDTYARDVTFPQYSAQGVWTIVESGVHLIDWLGNRAYVRNAELQQRGINIAIGNGSFESSYQRSIDVGPYTGRWVRGKVRSDARACGNAAHVLLQRKTASGWRTIGDAWTGDGKNAFIENEFAVRAVKMKPVTHRVLVKAFDVGTPTVTTCGRAAQRFRVEA